MLPAGEKRVLSRAPKGRGAKFFFEVPIILEEIWTEVEVAKWEKEFKKHAKFILQREI